MATAVSRGTSIAVAPAGSTWTFSGGAGTSANAYDGTAGVYTTTTYCVFTNAASGGVGTVTIGGYFGAGSIGASDTVTAVSGTIRGFVGTVARWTSVTLQLQDSAGTSIGAAQSVTLTGWTSVGQLTFTPNVVPTTAQCLAGLRVLVTATHAGTTSSPFNLDCVDITVTLTPGTPVSVAPSGASATLTGGVPIIGAGVRPAGASLSTTAGVPPITGGVFLDPFTRANSAVTLGGNWTSQNNTLGISSNQAYNPGAVANLASSTWVSPIATDDVVASISYATAGTPSGFNAFQILIGGSASGDHAYFYLDDGGSWAIGSTAADWTEAAGVNRTTGTITFTTTGTMSFQRSGTLYTAQVNGVTVGTPWNDVGGIIPINSSHRLVGITIINNIDGNNPRADDFLAQPLVAGAVSVTPSGASLSLTGGVPLVAAPRAVAPTGGALSLTGGTPLVAAPVAVNPALASLSLTGAAPPVTAPYTVTPTGASLTATGGVPTVATPTTVTPTGGTLSLTGGTPLVATPVSVNPAGASLALTAGTPLVTAPYTVTATGGALAVTGSVAGVATPVAVNPGGASVAVTTGTPLVSAPVADAPTGATLTVTAGTPLVATPIAVTPAGASLSTVAGSPAVTAPYTVTPAGAAAAITGGAGTVSTPTVAAGTGASLSLAAGTPTIDTRISAAAATLATTLGVPVVTRPVAVNPTGATPALTGGVPPVARPVAVAPASASLALTAGTPLVTAAFTVKPVGASRALTAGTPLVTVTLSKVDTLVDDFATRDTTRWDWGQRAGLVDQRVLIDPSYPSDTEEYAVTSTGLYDLTNSAIYVQVPQVLNLNHGTDFLYVAFRLIDSTDPTNFFDIHWMDGSGVTNLINYNECVADTDDATSATYGPLTHRWWRIRHSGTTVFWDTSVNGKVFTNRRSKTPVLPVNSLRVSMVAGVASRAGAPGFAIFDNINTVVPTVDTFTDDFTTANTTKWSGFNSLAAVSGGHLAITPTPDATQPSGPDAAQQYALAFEDTFTGTSLDLDKWAPSYNNGSEKNNVITDPANVTVTGGELVLTVSDATHGACVTTNPAMNWDNPTRTGFTYRTGVAEALCYFPGNGTELYNWPSFWETNGWEPFGAWNPIPGADPSTYPEWGIDWGMCGEIDTAEVDGSGHQTGGYIWDDIAIHSPTAVGGRIYNAGYLPGWHTYTVERTQGLVELFIDGVSQGSQATDDGEAAHSLILLNGVRGAEGVGGPTATGSAGAVHVDYVRAWSSLVDIGITSNARYDLTGTSVFVQATPLAASSADFAHTDLRLCVDEHNFFSVYWGDAAGSANKLHFVECVDDVDDETTLTYNATTHKFWRIRHSGSTVFWDTSPDGITWTNRRSKTPTLPVDSLKVKLWGGTFNITGAPGTATFDNLNNMVVAPAAASLSLTAGSPPVTAPYTVTPTAAALALTGAVPPVATPIAIQPAAATLTVTAGTPLVTAIGTAAVNPSAAALTVTTGTPVVTAGGAEDINPTGGVLALTGGTPQVAVSVTVTVAPTAAALTLTASPPALHATLTPTGGTVSLGGGTPALTNTRLIQPAAAALALTTSTPPVAVPYTVRPTGAALAVTPHLVDVIVGSVPPATRTLVVHGGRILVLGGRLVIFDRSAP